MSQNQVQPKYPSAFLYGASLGVLAQFFVRAGTYEKLSARPFSYLASGISVGLAMWYFDYWRRCSTEEMLYKEERRRYNLTVRGMNRVRAGQENEIKSMVDYLQNQTVRE